MDWWDVKFHDALFALDVMPLAGRDLARVEYESVSVRRPVRYCHGRRASMARCDDHVANAFAAAMAVQRLRETFAGPSSSWILRTRNRCGPRSRGGGACLSRHTVGRAVDRHSIRRVKRDVGSKQEHGLDSKDIGSDGSSGGGKRTHLHPSVRQEGPAHLAIQKPHLV